MSMHHLPETNPHFHPSQPPTRPHAPGIDFAPPPRRQGRTPPPPRRQGRTPPPPQLHHDSNPQFFTPPLPHVIEPSLQPHPNQPPRRQSRPLPQRHGDSNTPPPPGPPRHHKEPTSHLPVQPHPVPPYHHANDHGHGPRLPTNRKTKPLGWLIAAFCALFWIIIIVGGLIILIVYLVFRPRNPKFDISTVTLNAAYLDMGYLLNADLRVLANFTNPNSKVNVDFSYVVFDLFYNDKFIATRYIEPFSVMRGEYKFADVHLVSSQVRLSLADSLYMQKQMENGRVNYEIRGLFRAKSKLVGFLRYSYWLYAHCKIVVGDPPTGVLISKRCETKR
ncbi:NDR1/HIN1-like protein 13 [Forsythia ovata]|uniref:NDR1/HIN1-like protein 13 n=1 Tax=Forsythia ovata TaxID=205694 RepID=A0ABD1XG38_9LAMI